MQPVSAWALVPSETKVLLAVIETGSNKGAARSLGISPKTVEAHMTAVIQKAGVAGHAGRTLVLIAFDRAWRRACTPGT